MKKILFASALLFVAFVTNAQSNSKDQKKITGKWVVWGIGFDDRTFQLGSYGLAESLSMYIKKTVPNPEYTENNADTLLLVLSEMGLAFDGKGEFSEKGNERIGKYILKDGKLTFTDGIDVKVYEYSFKDQNLILTEQNGNIKLKVIFRTLVF